MGINDLNMKNIKALFELMKNSDITKFEYCEGDIKIKLCKTTAKEKKSDEIRHFSGNPSADTAAAAPSQIENTLISVTETQLEQKTEKITLPSVDFNNLSLIKAPLIGVFYSSPVPDAPPFVTIGAKVKKGDVLCIIEAMKLMNEITSDCDGEIVDICIKNGDIAEYGQVLFKINRESV